MRSQIIQRILVFSEQRKDIPSHGDRVVCAFDKSTLLLKSFNGHPTFRRFTHKCFTIQPQRLNHDFIGALMNLIPLSVIIVHARTFHGGIANPRRNLNVGV